MCCCCFNCILLSWSLTWELSVLLYCLMCSWKQKKKKPFHFYFYFTFSCPSNCSPTLHSTHSKSPRQPDAANCWETAAAQGCPLHQTDRGFRTHPDRSGTNLLHVWLGGGRVLCVTFPSEQLQEEIFFVCFFVDASITSSSDCFKNTPVSLFSTVKSPLTVEWLNSLGYHI